MRAGSRGIVKYAKARHATLYFLIANVLLCTCELLMCCRLAEKDAAMMGGFGAVGRLQDPDDDLGIPRINVGASQQGYNVK